MVIERHHDYIVPAGAIANGATNRSIRLQFDQDAPFALRGIGGYFISAAPAAVQLNGGFLRFGDAEDNWLATALVGRRGDWGGGTFGGGGGFAGQYAPVWPQIMYPAGSAIRMELLNASGVNWPDVKIVLRGVKLFHQGMVWSPSYPDCYRSIPFLQRLQFSIAANQTLRDIPLSVQSDADFVFRGGSLDRNYVVALESIANLALRFKDYAGQPYSNDFIHVSWLFPEGEAFDPKSDRPGVFYPEIYIPRTQQIFVDAQQGQAAAAVVQLVLMGAKIFPKAAGEP